VLRKNGTYDGQMDVWGESQESSVELNGRLGVEGVTDVVRHRRLRGFGHLKRKGREDWVSNAGAKELGARARRHGWMCSTRPAFFGPQSIVGTGQE